MKLAISVCRPMEGMSASACNGAMACLVNQSGHTNIHQSVPLALGYQVGNMSNVHMAGGLLTAVYSSEMSSCENHKRLVKVHFLCPSGIQVRQCFVSSVPKLSLQEWRRRWEDRTWEQGYCFMWMFIQEAPSLVFSGKTRGGGGTPFCVVGSSRVSSYSTCS